MRQFFTIILLLLLLHAPIFARADPLRLATLAGEPYIGHDLPKEGYVGEVVRTAFARSGRDVQFIYLPWKRAVEETRAGKFHGYLPEYFDAKRIRDFVFSAPFPGGKLMLFSRKNADITYSSLRDLIPYRIGVVRGYVNTRRFDSTEYLHKQEVMDDLTNLRMLLHDRVDLIVADLHVARYLASKKLQAAQQIKALQPPLQHKRLHVCFPKARPDHMELLRAFDAGLAAIKADGSLKHIINRHGFGSLH